MDEYIRAYKPNKGEIYSISTKTIMATEDIKIGDFVTFDDSRVEMIITKSEYDNTIGIVQEHIIEKYKFREVWSLFIKFILRKDKINCLKVKITK